MAKGEAGLFVEYCAKDFLDGTQMLDPWEELAYRRICDLIYACNDRLPDDDKKLAWMTKTGRRWPAIKKALTGGDRPKLIVVDGRITNIRCQEALATATQRIAQKVGAGRASAASGKSLKNLKQHRTDVRGTVRDGDRTEHRTYPRTQEPNYIEPDGSMPATSAAADPTRAIFDRGLAILGSTRRSLLGKLCKKHGEPAVLQAIVACEEEHPVEPAAYLIGCLARDGPTTNSPTHHGSPGANLFEGAHRAAESVIARHQGNLGTNSSFDEPLLDRSRPAAGSAGAARRLARRPH